MHSEPSVAGAVAQVLSTADSPLTVAEILARAERIRPVHTSSPQATVRGAIGSHALVAPLGGRPARYTWWPRHLHGSAFRQNLTELDPASGRLVLDQEVWLALWPTFYADRTRPGDITLVMDDGAVLSATIGHLKTGEAVWGILPNPDLAAWLAHVGATTEDVLIFGVIDVAARRYSLNLERRRERNELAVTARNQMLADMTAQILENSRDSLLESFLVARLIAHDVYCHAVPPDALSDVLRKDGRFVCSQYDFLLVDKIVDAFDPAPKTAGVPRALARPRGDRRTARSEKQSRAWAEYLFNQGMEYLWVGRQWVAEAFCREATRLDPNHADAWVHLGNIRFDDGHVREALSYYERGEAAALARIIGDPETYSKPFWLDLDSRPYMRALHGKGICYWRLGQKDDARRIFGQMLRLNPNDNQGVRFLMAGIDRGLTWEEEVARSVKESLG